MDDQMERSQKIIISILYVLVVFGLSHLLGIGINSNINIPMQFLIVVLVSLLVKFFIYNPFILYILLSLSLILSVMVHRFIRPFIFDFLDRVIVLFKNIYNNFQGIENIQSENILFYWIIIVTVISLFTALSLFKRRFIYLLLPVYLSFYVIYWYNYYDISLGLLASFLFFFIILLGLYNYNKEKDSNRDGQSFLDIYPIWLRTTIAYSFIILALAIVLPKSYNYIRWDYLSRKVYSTFPIVEELRSYNEYTRSGGNALSFDFSITGFQNTTSRLGGPVELSQRKIMTIRAKEKTYLRGKVNHIYSGYSWEPYNFPFLQRRVGSTYNFYSFNERDMYNEEYISILNHRFSSTTIFTTLWPTEVITEKGNTYLMSEDREIVFGEGIYEGENYFVRVQRPEPYGIQVARGVLNYKEDLENINVYLSIPNDTITQRTRSLSRFITDGLDTDFQKASAIESYLRRNYEYKLDVAQVPEDKDFVDFFLFDSREGYCTYYASAMAILLRLEGIPSRYVEGYLAYDRIDSDLYEVRQEHAHAWVEAFIEPVGWMTFEPTPAYSTELRLENYIEPEDDDDIVTPGSETPTSPTDVDGPGIDADDDIRGPSRDPGGGDEPTPTPDETNNYLVFLVIVAGLLIVPFRFIYGFILYSKEIKKHKHKGDYRYLIYIYKQIITLNELLGYPQLPGETHFDYSKRIGYKFYDYNEAGFNEITNTFVEAKYGDKEISKDHIMQFEKYRETLESKLRIHWGLRIYYYRKYVSKRYWKI